MLLQDELKKLDSEELTSLQKYLIDKPLSGSLYHSSSFWDTGHMRKIRLKFKLKRLHRIHMMGRDKRRGRKVDLETLEMLKYYKFKPVYVIKTIKNRI